MELSGPLSWAWGKLKDLPLKLALIFACVRSSITGEDNEVQSTDLEDGIRIAAFFKNEARRLYAPFDESDEDAERRKLADWIAAKGGAVTVRKLQQGNRRYKQPGEAEKALTELVNLGYGSWQTPTGRPGQPAQRFILLTQPTVYGNCTNSEERKDTVDVDTVDTTANAQGNHTPRKKERLATKRLPARSVKSR